MENEGKFGTISIYLKMVLKESKAFNEFKRKNIRHKSKMYPPPGEPEGKNSSKIISVKSTKPRMVKDWEFGKGKIWTKPECNHNNCKEYYIKIMH